jgi:hypothetical protein
MKPDHVVLYRKQLETVTELMVGDEARQDSTIEIASIAISLRRIADGIEKSNSLMKELTNIQRTKR